MVAYRIRYGDEKLPRMNRFWIQCVISFGLGLAIFAGSTFLDQDASHRGNWILPVYMRSDEVALKQMAESISAGEGWYASAVAYCREIMQIS